MVSKQTCTIRILVTIAELALQKTNPPNQITRKQEHQLAEQLFYVGARRDRQPMWNYADWKLITGKSVAKDAAEPGHLPALAKKI